MNAGALQIAESAVVDSNALIFIARPSHFNRWFGGTGSGTPRQWGARQALDIAVECCRKITPGRGSRIAIRPARQGSAPVWGQNGAQNEAQTGLDRLNSY